MARRRKVSTRGDFSSEILGFPALSLADLPLPVTLWLDVPGAPVPVCLSTAAPEPGAACPALGAFILFDRDELRALVSGAVEDRVWRKELLAFCFEKWRRPSLRIDARDTLAGAMPSDGPPQWSVAELLDRLGATLVRVDVVSDAASQTQPGTLPAAA